MSDPQYRPFRKSKRSDSQGNCVEVADEVNGRSVLVRDSKDPNGPRLTFGASSWNAFVHNVKGLTA